MALETKIGLEMKSLMLMATVFCFLSVGCSRETPIEKAQVKVSSAERSIDRTSHRVDEAICGTLTGDNKAQCLAKKIKNRVIEGKDTVVDKASEIKDKAD